jgi:four helix bundle protein
MAKPWDLRERTMQFAVATFRFCRTLPKSDEASDIVRQLRRAASSVAANCRATRRAQSDRAFVSKAAIVIEEADEAGFWLEFLVRVELIKKQVAGDLSTEANELVAMKRAKCSSTVRTS